MAKTNFTKVEDALNEGILKMSVQNLLEATDTKAKLTPQQKAEYGKLLASLHADLNYLNKKGKNPYTSLKIDKEQVLKFFENPSALMPHEWELIKQWKSQTGNLKEKTKQEVAPESDEEIVKQQRRQHINKRFNIKDKWLPLK